MLTGMISPSAIGNLRATLVPYDRLNASCQVPFYEIGIYHNCAISGTLWISACAMTSDLQTMQDGSISRFEKLDKFFAIVGYLHHLDPDLIGKTHKGLR